MYLSSEDILHQQGEGTISAPQTGSPATHTRSLNESRASSRNLSTLDLGGPAVLGGGGKLSAL